MVLMLSGAGGEVSRWEGGFDQPQASAWTVAHSEVLAPDPSAVPFFRAIGEDQEKRLTLCKTEDECQAAHFMRGLAALYENRELAALHFRKVVVARPNSTLAEESRFWLWLLDVLNAPEGAGISLELLAQRLTREVIEKELLIHELSGKVENSSVEALQREMAIREKAIEELNVTVATLTKQVEQLKKEQAQQRDAQQELKASEKKVQELTNQLEALRRIDQEIKEKAPPTRPSEKMTPIPEVEKKEPAKVPVTEKKIEKEAPKKEEEPKK